MESYQRCPACGERFEFEETHTCRESKMKLIALAEEKGIHGLVAALKNPKVNDSCNDLNKCGWIRCSTNYPEEGEEVLVTNGEKIGLGIYWRKSKENEYPIFKEDQWTVTGYTKELCNSNIVAWTYKPDLTELQEFLKNV